MSVTKAGRFFSPGCLTSSSELAVPSLFFRFLLSVTKAMTQIKVITSVYHMSEVEIAALDEELGN